MDPILIAVLTDVVIFAGAGGWIGADSYRNALIRRKARADAEILRKKRTVLEQQRALQRAGHFAALAMIRESHRIRQQTAETRETQG